MGNSNKQWAHEYILEPLISAEPSQETGPGTSFYNPNRSFSNSRFSTPPPGPRLEPSPGPSPNQRSRPSHIETRKNHPRSPPPSYTLTPPSSAGPTPTRSSFHHSNPFSRPHPSSPLASPVDQDSPLHHFSPTSPSAHSASYRRYPPAAASSSLARSSSARVPDRRHHRTLSSASADAPRPGNLFARFPGDLSHRPLEMIKQETRAANRSSGSSKSHRRAISDVDTIDALDTIGGMYHHGGPFDATLASRNVNVKYPPVDAVQETNMEAIRATPREYIQDSLTKHVPLQGIASIPPGQPDMSGKPMQFEEGADLMREPDAAGGAYRRWEGFEGLTYHPDDLKGKGEPSYTIEKEKGKGKGLHPNEYEMQAGVNGDGFLGPAARPRSVSNVDKSGTAATSAHAVPTGEYDEASGSGVRRSNSTGGKKLSDGIKRRFGSLRRKRGSGTTVEQAY